MEVRSGGHKCRGFGVIHLLLIDLCQELVVAEQRVLLLANLNRAAAVLRHSLASASQMCLLISFHVGHTLSTSFLVFTSEVRTYLRYQNLVTGLYARCNPLSILVHCTRPDSQYLGLVQFLDRRFW
jgi:hypothetical protein